MRIVIVHNRYRQRGGEDAVVQAEAALLARHGHAVERIVYYTLTTDRGQRSLLVHVTKDGLITDFDDVVD